MKSNITGIKSILFIVLVLFIYSCKKDNNGSQNQYLVKYEFVKSTTTEQNQGGLLIASFYFPEFDSLVPYCNYGSEVYTIQYNTTFLGKPIIASGLVMLPQTDSLFPMISFQNATSTCNANAPSENANSQFFTIMSMMAGTGYIIGLSDYIGFGASSQILHPYLHTESTVTALKDFIAAVQELTDRTDVKAKFDGDLYLMGYSQGGWATLSLTKELENNPLSGCNLTAAAAGAGAYDLMGMAHYILGLDEYSTPYFLPNFIESRRQNNLLTEPLIYYFKEPYATEIPSLFDGTVCNSEINSHFPFRVKDFLSDDMYSNFDNSENLAGLRNELQANSVNPWTLNTRLHLYHSFGDKTIPYTQSENMYLTLMEDFAVTSDRLSLTILMDTLDHEEAIIPWGIDAMMWFKSIK